MRGLDQPIVGAINGVAAGAGASLAFACDLRIAAEGARFVLAFGADRAGPGQRRDVVSCRGSSAPAKAAELALLGEPLSAADAERFGLVAPGRPGRATSRARRGRSPPGWPPGRAACARPDEARPRAGAGRSTFEEALEDEATLQGEAGATADHAEGIAAFLEKRPPRFPG